MTTSAIRMTGVTRTYPGPPEVHALQPTDLDVRSGEYLTIIGPSGSGKSTLLNLIGLLDRPSTGSYEFCGTDVSDLDDHRRTDIRADSVGFVFQSFHLLSHRSAVENVALAQLYVGVHRRERTSNAVAALERVGLGHRVYASVGTMSGGEQQRVAIARAIVHRPTVLLCDEPTGNLDSATAESVLTLIDELHRGGMTLVVITHDPAVAASGERTITIRDGAVS
jgi:putative ABC transport system ATP-binding protein